MTSRWLARGEPHLPESQVWLSALELARADSLAFTKRRREYLVARWTLKQAVASARQWEVDPARLARVEARPATDGAPELFVDGEPAGLDVSLTDRAGWAVCVLAPAGAGVGVDLELVEPRSPAFVRDYLTPAEQHAVAMAAAARADGHDLAANLIWSATESALKVLRTGLRRDTRSVEVTIDSIDVGEGVWSPLVATTTEGECFHGWWRRTGAFILTTCARSTLPEPLSLELPPALDRAQPLHSWLEQPRSYVDAH